MSAVVLGCRCLLIGIFAVSAVTKLRNGSAFRAFAGSLVELRLVRPRRSTVLAGAVAAAESAVVLLLVVPGATGLGFAVAAGLLTVFAVGIARSLARGISVPCRCFGASRTPLGRVHVVRNAVLALVAVTGGVATGLSHAPPQPTGTVLAVFGAALGTLAVVFFDDLVALSR